MFRRLSVIGLSGLALTFGLATAASAAPTTTTTTEKIVENFDDVVPTCGEPGELYHVTVTANSIEHETVFDDGRVHATFTEAGKVRATPVDGTGPSFTGHLAIWGNFNQNAKTSNSTFTFNITLNGSDGSRISHHENAHSNVRPNGEEVFFEMCH